MATISTFKVDARGVGNPSRKPYMVQTTIDFGHADLDALSAGDIVEAITIPTNTMVLTAGAEMIESVQSGADGNTVNLGITDVDQYISGADIDDDSAILSSGVGYLTPAAEAGVPFFVGATSDTLDLELQATSTAPNTGQIRIFAILMDIDAMGNQSTVHFAADGANEVDRDLLA
jgi:hypothetical protein